MTKDLSVREETHCCYQMGRKEENILFNNTLNTFYIVMWHQTYDKGSLRERKPTAATIWEGRKKMFYLTTHSTHFIYGYMASDIW